MNVFLDTNVLLGLFRLTGPDLEEVRRFIALAEHKQFNVYINTNVEDEFRRNREGIIAESMKYLEKIHQSSPIPNLVKPYPQAANLREAMAVVSKTVKALEVVVRDDVAKHALKADAVVTELFKKFKAGPISNVVLTKARSRVEFGRPPGKAGKVGDAVNWEWLLENAPANEPLHIISHDGDFESVVYPSEVKEYLIEEWSAAKVSELSLHKSLLAFLTKCFPDFKLADEVEKVLAIERLVESFNFADTHRAIAKLNEYAVFSEGEITQMLEAMSANTQISWILGDDDVTEFARKLVGMAKSDTAKASAGLVKEQLDKNLAKATALGKVFGADSNDDIQF